MLVAVRDLAAIAIASAGVRVAAAQTPKTSNAMTSPAAFIVREQSIYDAMTKGDVDTFDKTVGGDFIYQSQDGTQHYEIVNTASMLADCKTGKMTMDDTKVAALSPDVVVITGSLASRRAVRESRRHRSTPSASGRRRAPHGCSPCTARRPCPNRRGHDQSRFFFALAVTIMNS